MLLMGFSCDSGFEGEHAAFAAADEDLLEGDLRPVGLRAGHHVGVLVVAVPGQHGLAAKITPLLPASRMQIASRSPIGQSDRTWTEGRRSPTPRRLPRRSSAIGLTNRAGWSAGSCGDWTACISSTQLYVCEMYDSPISRPCQLHAGVVVSANGSDAYSSRWAIASPRCRGHSDLAARAVSARGCGKR